jgi:hypothetical protein
LSAEALASGDDAGSLGFDSVALPAALRSIASSSAPIRTYAALMKAIPLGPQPIVIGGQSAGTFDPLAKRPELANALHVAQRNADNVLSYLDTLHAWASGAGADLLGNITKPLAAAKVILDKVPVGGSLSAADAAAISTHIHGAHVFIQLVTMAMGQIASGVKTFLNQLVTDHATLAGGPLDLASASQDVARQISDQAQKYVINPMTRGIGETMLQIGREFTAAADRTAAVIGTAMTGLEAMRTGASALAVAAATAVVKVDKAATAVASADSATLSAVLRRINLAPAIASWEQFDEFFKRSGL